jgi:hypothetical protein
MPRLPASVTSARAFVAPTGQWASPVPSTAIARTSTFRRLRRKRIAIASSAAMSVSITT